MNPRRNSVKHIVYEKEKEAYKFHLDGARASSKYLVTRALRISIQVNQSAQQSDTFVQAFKSNDRMNREDATTVLNLSLTYGPCLPQSS